MSINIENCSFEGPFASTSNLKDQSGVYLILGNHSGDNWNLVDVGESSQVKYRIDNHDRKVCWNQQNYANLKVAVLYTDENSRMRIEAELRSQYNLPCGQR
ncbi:MAG: hypothetical protein F4073_07500 [Rhodobacteraceae bacterium]|nr:hypothetical protein [Paracoccaceae bacterium]MYF45205.1 hypothetical protein [Paracoccaceae bacterium]MYI91783.1 hypothetical protein [Paracoccaceae bacterium]